MRKINHISEVLEDIRDKDHLVFHPSVNESPLLGQQLAELSSKIGSLNVDSFLPALPCPYLDQDTVKVQTSMPGPHLRKPVNDGRVGLLRDTLWNLAKHMQAALARSTYWFCRSPHPMRRTGFRLARLSPIFRKCWRENLS